MLKEYVEINGFIRIPLTAGRYCISLDGKVIGEDGKEILKTIDEDGDLQIWGELYNGYQFYKVALLSVICFKSIKISWQQWDKLGVMFIDGNRLNIHPSNLILKLPKGGLEHPKHNGFYYIPGCSYYLIDKYGRVYSRTSDRMITIYNLESGYRSYSIRTDLGEKYTLGRHRALALAFLEYTANVDDLDVNHINGIRGSDDLSNLEWCTRQHNCNHAYANNLRTDNKHILVKNIYTDEIIDYYSRGDCSRRTGVLDVTVDYRTKTDGQVVFDDCFLYKKKDSLSDWIDLATAISTNAFIRFKTPVKVKNVLTGEIVVYESITAAAAATGIERGTIDLRLVKNANTDYVFGYQFKSIEDKTDWLDIKNSTLVNLRTEVKIKDIKTGTITTHDSIKSASIFTNIPKNRIEYILKTNNEKAYMGYQFKYFLDSTEWLDITDINYGYKKINASRKVECSDTSTNSIRIFDTLREAERVTGVSVRTIREHLSNPEHKSYKNLKFSEKLN